MSSLGSKRRNPYNDWVAVRDASMFFGRKRELERLFSFLAARQSVSVIGSWRIGKSSVLGCMRLPAIQQRFFEDDISSCILVLIDLKEYLHRTRDNFFTSVCEQIILQGGKRLALAPSSTTRSGQDAFQHLLNQVDAAGYHLVLLMDAFDNVVRNAEFDADFLAFMRSQADWRKVSYVTASVAPLARICHEDIVSSPFFNIFATCHLGPLTSDEAQELITQPASAAGHPFNPTEVNWVMELAGRHPFLIQRVCYALFDEKSHNLDSPTDHKHVRNLVFDELLSHFKSAWSHLSPEQQDVLKREARRGHAQTRAIPELSESALFRIFVCEECGVNLVTMTVKDVEKALKDLDDSQALGEGPLSYLNSVAQYLMENNNPSPSTVERGMAVREVLRSAFERMRAQGTRTDSAYEWRLYNVLYYRYFKYHLRNAQIEARLGVEERQFFRYREDAIETLFNILSEQEAQAKEEGPTKK